MDSLSLYTRLNRLPDSLKAEVVDFLEFLETKAKKRSGGNKKNKPKFGSAKGMFVMGADFDEPLEDFKEYM